VITLELKTGTTYRGKLLDAEDNMNCQLKDITVTERDGRVSQLDQVFIRGSQVRFYIVPDMLKNAPMFKKIQPGAVKGKGIGLTKTKVAMAARGRGRASVIPTRPV
jgi:small nuclear ribonucleoprotein D3